MTCGSAYRLQSYTRSRHNAVSVLNGYRILEKFILRLYFLVLAASENSFLVSWLFV